MGGPIWSAPIHDQEWVNFILEDVKSMKDHYPAYDRISAVLTTISEACSSWFFAWPDIIGSVKLLHFLCYCQVEA